MHKIEKIALCALMLLAFSTLGRAQEPSGTYMFAQRDTCELFLDVYNPTPGSVQEIDGVKKPAIIFMFGGGFMEGERNNWYDLPWFKSLNDEGYRVFSIDYRLGLKGVTKMGLGQSALLINAVNLAIEDLYSATNFILDNAEEFGIEPDGLVISGSSAGAITVMQAEYELANRTPISQVLPEDFDYAGVMSFSGAVYSNDGKASYKREPAPTLMFHGTADKLVPYKELHIFRKHFAGTQKLAPIFFNGGYNVNIIRYEGHGHEIASAMPLTMPEQVRFLEVNVMKKQKRIIDTMVVDDPDFPFPSWGRNTASDLYK